MNPLQEAIEKQLAEESAAKERAAAEEAARQAPFPGKGMPSGFANQFYVLVGPTATRLVLGEQVFNEPPNYTWAFTIPTGVAKDMAETILRIIVDQTPTWDAAQKATTDGDKN